MKSRERVLKALVHEIPDHTPLDLSAHRSSGIAAIAYVKLRRYLGLPEKPVRVYDMVQQLAIIDDDVLDLFGVDTIEMGRGFLTDEAQWKEWILPDGTPCLIPYYIHVEKRAEDWYVVTESGLDLAVQKHGCLYFEQNYYPLLERGIADDDFSDLEEILGDTIWTGIVHPGAHLALDAAGLADLAEGAKNLYSSTERAVVGLFGGNMFELPQWLYRMDNYLMYMGLYPAQVERLSERLCEIHLRNLEKWLSAVGQYIDIIAFGDDLGGQNGPLISPDMYRRFYKPYHQKMWQKVKEIADVIIMLHCCGGVRELLPDLIDAGLEAINPVQVNCRGMDAAELKAEFGSRMAFWGGGCDTRFFLPHGTPQEIKKHVHTQIATLGPGGGFIFQQIHNVLADVPPANITAMLEAINSYGCS